MENFDADDSLEAASEARAKILEDLYRGRLTIPQALTQATSSGVNLERTPDPAEYQPQTKSRWSLLMTMAWIIWRSPDEVRAQWDAYRNETLLLRNHNVPAENGSGSRPCAHLEQLGDAYYSRFFTEYDIKRRRRTPVLDIDKSEDDLWGALRGGQIIAEAISADGTPCIIPAIEWKSLSFNGRNDNWPGGVSGGNRSYHDVEVLRSRVMELWPAVIDSACANSPAAQVGAEVNPQADLPVRRQPKPADVDDFIEKHDQGLDYVPSELDHWEAAKKKWAQINRETVRKSRKRIYPVLKSGPRGPRKK